MKLLSLFALVVAAAVTVAGQGMVRLPSQKKEGFPVSRHGSYTAVHDHHRRRRLRLRLRRSAY